MPEARDAAGRVGEAGIGRHGRREEEGEKQVLQQQARLWRPEGQLGRVSTLFLATLSPLPSPALPSHPPAPLDRAR